MAIKYIKGNIFTTSCQVIVNPVNCVGVMGAGLAFEFRLRYPEMYIKYINICSKNLLKPGLLWLYKVEDKAVLNFPTKLDWKGNTTEQYLQSGLKKFSDSYKEKKISSIAFPLLGTDKGNLKKDASLQIMMQYLDPLDIQIEIYEYDSEANDDVFLKIKNILFKANLEDLSNRMKIRQTILTNIQSAINSGNFFQINQLMAVDGVGAATLIKIYEFCSKTEIDNVQHSLF